MKSISYDQNITFTYFTETWKNPTINSKTRATQVFLYVCLEITLSRSRKLIYFLQLNKMFS